MKRSGTVIASLLTLCLLVLGAALPLIVGTIQNRTGMHPGFGEILSVELEMQEPLSLMDKLYVMANGKYYPTTEDTALTFDQLPEVVEEGLGPYYYRELIPYNWKEISFDATAYVLYRPDEPEIHYTIWLVEIDATEWNLSMHVDDETAQILDVQYSATVEQQIYTAKEYTVQFQEAWFESLGLSDEDWKEVKYDGLNGNITLIRCTYSEEDYSFTAEFSTHPQGFWTFFYE